MIYIILIIFVFFTLIIGFQFFLITKSKAMKGKKIDFQKVRPELREKFKNDKTIVYFYSPTCTACKYQTPIIEKLKSEKFNTISIDVSKDLATARVFGIMGTPTIALMKGNLIHEFFVGYQDEEKLKESYNRL
mgnify:FL=1